MKPEPPKLGHPVPPDAARDAIHVAIAPMTAAADLSPGEHVGILPDGAGPATVPVGVVDPFRRTKVKQGERFWLCLYPGTVTGMRHEWEHPAFNGEAPRNASMIWIAEWAPQVGMTYAEAMEAAAKWLQDETQVDDDYKNYEVPAEFWTHYKLITGVQGEGDFFSCCI